jgi:hypothetical protein
MTTPIIRKAFNEFWSASDLEIFTPELYERVRNAFYRTMESNRENLLIEEELRG